VLFSKDGTEGGARGKRRQYRRLMQESNAISCESITQWYGRRQNFYHSPNCRKYQVRGSAENLQITVHEWPLPEAALEAKEAVFELDVPPVIAKWRDITYTLLVDVFLVHFLFIFLFGVLDEILLVRAFRWCSRLTKSNYSTNCISRNL
jgi:hypothetical protein